MTDDRSPSNETPPVAAPPGTGARGQIMGRRARFLAAALTSAGILGSSAGCEPCLSVVPMPSPDGGSVPEPEPSASVAPSQTAADTSAAPPPSDTAAATSSVAPEPSEPPPPRVCLRMAPPPKDGPH